MADDNDMSTNHAGARIEERLTDAGWSPEDQAKLAGFAEAFASKTDADSEAVRLARLSGQVNEKYGKQSNGDEVWAIYRGGKLKTVMLRRSSQPDANLRVAKVTRF